MKLVIMLEVDINLNIIWVIGIIMNIMVLVYLVLVILVIRELVIRRI